MHLGRIWEGPGTVAHSDGRWSNGFPTDRPVHLLAAFFNSAGLRRATEVETAKRSMRPVAAVALDVLMEDCFEVTTVDDDPAIDGLPADGADGKRAGRYLVGTTRV